MIKSRIRINRGDDCGFIIKKVKRLIFTPAFMF